MAVGASGEAPPAAPPCRFFGVPLAHISSLRSPAQPAARIQLWAGSGDISLQKCEMLIPLFVDFSLAPPCSLHSSELWLLLPSTASWSKTWCPYIIQHGITSLLVCFCFFTFLSWFLYLY